MLGHAATFELAPDASRGEEEVVLDDVTRHDRMQVLLNNRPEATTALLMQLCTPGDATKPDGDWLAKVSDFAHLAADRFASVPYLRFL